MDKTVFRLTDKQFSHLGGGVIGYVKEIAGEDATALLGQRFAVPPQARLFCLYNADGTPISISGSREAAVVQAMEHDLITTSLH